METSLNEKLHEAAYLGDTQKCSLLIKQGANVNYKNCLDITPLHAAASEGYAETTRFLLEQGADPNAVSDEWVRNETPLHSAARYGQEECCRILVQYGADKTLKDLGGFTPQELAWFKGHDITL